MTIFCVNALYRASSISTDKMAKKAKKNAKLGVNVQFSGHTHGGQYFFLFPIVYLLNNGYRTGFYEIDELSLYVSSGSGLWGYVPLRFGTDSEVLIHTLTKK